MSTPSTDPDHCSVVLAQDAEDERNPAARYVAVRLDADPRLEGFVVEAENFESIHNHSAYAKIARGFWSSCEK